MMRNRPEFHVADVAVVLVGATPISIYNSSSPDQIAYLMGHSGVVAAIVEDERFLGAVLSVRSELPKLRGARGRRRTGRRPARGRPRVVRAAARRTR